MAGTEGDGSAACCKVGRTAARYELEGLDEELAERWGGDGDSVGVRELAAEVNRRVLAEAMREAGLDPLDGEPENLLRLLTGDVPAGRRLDTRRRLERQDVDVDAVLSDTVSHQTVYNHLRGCLDVSKGADGDRLERRGSTLYALRNRTETVTRETLASLRDGGELDLDGFDVIVDVRVVCESCGRSRDLTTLIEAGGCECGTSY
jgi:hypothetical protein